MVPLEKDPHTSMKTFLNCVSKHAHRHSILNKDMPIGNGFPSELAVRLNQVPFLFLFAISFALVGPSRTSADVIQLDFQAFQLASQGQILFTEDFERFAPGVHATPFVRLNNGVTYHSPSPAIASLSGPGNELTDSQDITAARVLTRFSDQATLLKVEFPWLQDNDEYDVIVTTRLGDLLELRSERGKSFDGFFGVVVTGGDSLQSFSIQAVGGSSGPGGGGGGVGNFSMDNISVNAVAVPSPQTTVPVAFGALSCVFLLRRRWR